MDKQDLLKLLDEYLTVKDEYDKAVYKHNVTPSLTVRYERLEDRVRDVVREELE